MNKKILLVTGKFPIYDKYGCEIGKEFTVSHGVDLETGKNIILPCEHPYKLGGEFDIESGEWYLYE